MGAVYQEVRLNGTKEEVVAKFNAMAREDRHMNGHSYSGGFGMKYELDFVDFKRFETRRAATDWLEEHAEKWGPALAVQLANGSWVVGAICSE